MSTATIDNDLRLEATEARKAREIREPEAWRSDSLVQDVLRFGDWMDSHRQLPAVERICDYWGLGRATAYRWLAAYKAARGLPE